MKRLLLIRHGKSSWESPSGDFGRPLLDRGIEDSESVARHFARQLPDHFTVWSSTARRTVETSRIFASEFQVQPSTIVYRDELYTFDSAELEQIIKSADPIIETLILFGHNSAITDFVNKFGDIAIDNVATSGCVIIDFDIPSWSALVKGTTSNVVFPRDLKA